MLRDCLSPEWERQTAAHRLGRMLDIACLLIDLFLRDYWGVGGWGACAGVSIGAFIPYRYIVAVSKLQQHGRHQQQPSSRVRHLLLGCSLHVMTLHMHLRWDRRIMCSCVHTPAHRRCRYMSRSRTGQAVQEQEDDEKREWIATSGLCWTWSANGDALAAISSCRTALMSKDSRLLVHRVRSVCRILLLNLERCKLWGSYKAPRTHRVVQASLFPTHHHIVVL
jgi:hypothetical protein